MNGETGKRGMLLRHLLLPGLMAALTALPAAASVRALDGPWFPFTPPDPAPAPARLAIIIDDIGDHPGPGARAADLPGPVTLAVLPHTPHGARTARRAADQGQEIMLHLPMQPKSTADPGPGALTLDMDEHAVREAVQHALDDVPHAVGVNNHMGSLLTRHPGHMAWVMEVLDEAGDLYYIDSRTSARSVARDLARESGLAHAERHVFLDATREPDEIEAQLDRAAGIARNRGSAIAIGHPYPETLRILEERLPELTASGRVELVPASVVVEESASGGREPAGPPRGAQQAEQTDDREP